MIPLHNEQRLIKKCKKEGQHLARTSQQCDRFIGKAKYTILQKELFETNAKEQVYNQDKISGKKMETLQIWVKVRVCGGFLEVCGVNVCGNRFLHFIALIAFFMYRFTGLARNSLRANPPDSNPLENVIGRMRNKTILVFLSYQAF